MDFIGILVFVGFVALLYLTGFVIRLFNHSKSAAGWFTWLLGQTGVILSYVLLFDFMLLGLLLAMLAVYGIAYFPLSWAEQQLPPVWNYILVFFAFTYFFFWLWWTGSRKFYPQFSRYDQSRGTAVSRKPFKFREKIDVFAGRTMRILIPLMVIIGLVMLSIVCFGALTAALVRSGCVTFDPVPASQDMGQVTDFFLWHFMDLIPQVRINQTLGWEAPLTYKDGGIGLLLLVFKSLMAFIVIARFYTWNKWRKEGRKRQKPTYRRSRYYRFREYNRESHPR